MNQRFKIIERKGLIFFSLVCCFLIFYGFLNKGDLDTGFSPFYKIRNTFIGDGSFIFSHSFFIFQFIEKDSGKKRCY